MHRVALLYGHLCQSDQFSGEYSFSSHEPQNLVDARSQQHESKDACYDKGRDTIIVEKTNCE